MLPSIGTILMRGAFLRVGSMNCQRSRNPGRLLCCLSERTDEDEVDVVRQLLQQIFKASIAKEGNVMSLFSAPGTDHLRHDAGKIGIHDASIQRSRGAPGYDINDPDTKFSHVQYR